jgi:8-oxo-dGTP diphosphatase
MNKTVEGYNLEGEKIIMKVDNLFFRPSVYAVVVKDDKVLMIKFGDLGYYLIGGGVELGEDHQKALHREFLEETGFEITIKDLIEVNTYFFEMPFDGGSAHAIKIFYVCELIGDAKKQNFEEEEIQLKAKLEWVPLFEINNLKITSNDNNIKNIIKNCTKK